MYFLFGREGEEKNNKFACENFGMYFVFEGKTTNYAKHFVKLKRKHSNVCENKYPLL